LEWLCIKAPLVIYEQILNFGVDDFPFKIPFKKCFKIFFCCFGTEICLVLELQFLASLCEKACV